jgi:predicted RNA polymerase sigma factor
VLARRYGDFDAAEDAVQESLLVASTRWPRDGVPERAFGWLIQTATRRLIDQRRSEASRSRREELSARREMPPGASPGRDDTLIVLFMCCHPALTPASAIALTLRAVGGLTTAEIARAFMVPEATMAQRISRAKRQIRASGEPFRMPDPANLQARLRSVLHVLYLMFNEGYVASGGPAHAPALHRAELTDEAIRLTRMVRAALPEDSEVAGLLALMLLIDARRPARTDGAGDPVSLAEQDRSLWDRRLIAEGVSLLDGAVGRGAVGEYQLQAAIAALHDRAATAQETDWPQILALYVLLERMTDNPIVTLNRAVAVAMVHGPEAGLAVVDEAARRLPDHHRVDVVRAHLLEMAGHADAALACYRSAAARATNLPERHRLLKRTARLESLRASQGRAAGGAR